jgi:phospholipid/cholesterol/gamma-HCH transport system substrate-binding protein
VTGVKGAVAAAVAVALLAGCVGPLAGPEPVVYEAVVSRSNNLFERSEVKVAGLVVGRVTELRPDGPNVVVRMEVHPDVPIPADARARIKPLSLIGERFIQLEPAYTDGPVLEPGSQIPLERTGVPAEVDEVLASFERFMSELDPRGLADLIEVLADTLSGQGPGLNELIDEGATTIGVLADASDDLVGIARELGQLNETVATRDDRIGEVIEDWSTLTRTFVEESDEIIAGIGNLHRLTLELRGLLDDHADPLVRDIEVLTTSLSTVERNLERIGLLILGGKRLFEGAGRAIGYENAWLRVVNRGERLGEAITLRLRDRLVGTCLRLEIPECDTPDFWEPFLPMMVCLGDSVTCPPDQPTFTQALASALGYLPEGGLELLAEDLAERQQAAAEEPAPDPEPEAEPRPETEQVPLPEVPGLPLDTLQQDRSWRDRLASWIGGGP